VGDGLIGGEVILSFEVNTAKGEEERILQARGERLSGSSARVAEGWSGRRLCYFG
jgi:hypothetical protein